MIFSISYDFFLQIIRIISCLAYEDPALGERMKTAPTSEFSDPVVKTTVTLFY